MMIQYMIHLHQTQGSLTYQMLTSRFKEHVIYKEPGSHPNNLVCRPDPLDQSSDPNDPNFWSYPTHFQAAKGYIQSSMTEHV